MAIAATSPGTFDATTTAASYATPSWTPIAGEPVLVFVAWRKATAADAITSLTGTNGWNVTWTSMAGDITLGSALSRCRLFRGIPSSGTAGTLTATFPASQLQCLIIPMSFSGVDAASNQGVVQVVANSGSLTGSLAVTLAAFGSANNATALFGVARGTPTAFAAETGAWTSYLALGAVNGGVGTWLPSNDTTPTGTLTGGLNWAAVAVELKASVAVDSQLAMRRLGGIPEASRALGQSAVRIF